MPSTPHAITGDEFATWMQSFHFAAGEQTLAVAVSGGPDSMALALMARNWAKTQGKTILALIVDHALRPESGREAEETKARLAALDTPAEILLWQHGPITSKFHIQARIARYDLLTAACRAHDIKSILLAHHKDDQAETILMRIAKGSGIEGLAGMAAFTHLDDVRLLRPVMQTSKERLVATCDAAQISYVSDPSNVSDKFARGRLRRVLPLLEEDGLSADRLCDLGVRASVVKDALKHYTDEFMLRAVHDDDYGVIRLNLPAAQNVPRAIFERGFVECLQTIHAETYAPEYKSLTAFLDALNDPDFSPRTIHGCLVSRRGDDVIIMREIAAITDRPQITDQTHMVWDKRWQLLFTPPLGAQAGDKITIRSLGTPPHDIIDCLAPKLRHTVPQGRARATLPALWQGEKILLIPSFDWENNHLSTVTAQLMRHIQSR